MSTIQRSLGRERPRGQPILVQLWDTFLMELTNWRWAWRGQLLSGTITPLFSLVAMGFFARDSGQETLVYVVTGNIVVGLLFGTMTRVQGRVIFLRVQGGLDYVATLPIQRYVFVLALVLAFFLLTLPSVIVTMILGPLLLHIPLAIHPLIVLVVPLCTVPLAGLGALLGLVGRTQVESSNLTFLVTLGMTLLGPVVAPPDRLPRFMRVLGRLSPATYAASALRQVMVGPLTVQILVDLGVLGAIAALSLWLVGRRINWRQE